MAQTNPLLVTKTYIPTPRADLTPRPRLMEKLNDALRQAHKLILVSAPAGFGKTTLITDWLRQVGLPAAWVSLDKEDNNPARFWRYVISAFQTVQAALGLTAQAALETPQLPPLELMLASLINDLSLAARPMLLVLDDYHFIEAGSIHSSLDYFIDRLPVNLCLVIATRVTPPLALARLRGRGQITEARTADLRFTGEETQVLLNTINRLELSDQDILSLENRTEGWIVGLQMAVLSLRLHEDKHAFIEAFAGDDHYVVDYLLEEVLQHQAQDIQTFLLQTSFLERLSGTLCEAVTGRCDSQAILMYLEQANLFVTSLDNRHYWYRYHHLFADLLRRRLQQTLAPAEWKALYHRACAWYEQEGLIVEAVSQALAMPDFELAADLMEKHILTVFYRSETVLVHQWLKALPDAEIRARPLLCAVYANTIIHMNKFAVQSLPGAEAWLQAAEQKLENSPGGNGIASGNHPDASLVRSFIRLSYAYLALWRNDPPEKVISLAENALAGLPSVDDASIDPNFLRFHSGLNCNLGMSYMKLGDQSAASLAFGRARQIGEACGDLLNASAAVGGQSTVLYWQGRLPEAVSLCQDALKSFSAGGQSPAPSIPFVGIVYVCLGTILVEWNNLDEAEPMVLKSLELSKLTSGFDIQLNGHIVLARLKQARGENLAALALLDQIDGSKPEIKDLIDSQRVRFWLAQGNLAAAARWAQGRQFPEALDHKFFSLARVHIALHLAAPQLGTGLLPDLGCLVRTLQEKIQALENTTWVACSIELLILHALACQALNNLPGALASLQRAVTLAAPGSFIRLFIDEGAPLRLLLAKLKNNGGSPQAYINKLLAAWGEARTSLPSALGSWSLPEPLSSREMEVLRLLAAGCTNSEIASRLVITLNTTKKHLSNLYGKLAVANRMDAVAHARELGLVV